MSRLGQHFLKNRTVLRKIAAALKLADGDTVIEAGPGHGELTQELMAARESRGIKLIAIEKDPTLAATLAKKFSGGEADVEILSGDALQLLSPATQKIGTPEHGWKFVGNIPYYITGKLFRTLGELENRPAIAVIMVQREVAERICAAPPDMNRLAASVQFWADTNILMHVPKTDFSPIPKVDSAIVVLVAKTRQERSATGHYYESVRSLFSQPRKTILNNLSSTLKDRKKASIEDSLTKIGLNSGLRPQDLTIQNIEDVARAFFS